MYGQNDHLSESVNEALTELCESLERWEKSTGERSILILRCDNGEARGSPMTKPGYIFRAIDGVPLGANSDNTTDAELLNRFTATIEDAASRDTDGVSRQE